MATAAVGRGGNVLDGHVKFTQQALGNGNELTPSGGSRYLASSSLEQLQADIAFQLFDCQSYRWL
jgi:hypothetical protein